MWDLVTTQHGYTPGVSARKVSTDAYGPLWRRRIADAVEPHGRLKALADAAKMTSSQLQKIANGTTENPGVVVLTRIAHAMGITLGDLVIEPGPERTRANGETLGGDGGGGAGLADSLRGAIVEYEQSGTAPKDWRGDVLVAIFALTRALQRPPITGESEEQDRKAQ